jgi:hypothetical protein
LIRQGKVMTIKRTFVVFVVPPVVEATAMLLGLRSNQTLISNIKTDIHTRERLSPIRNMVEDL